MTECVCRFVCKRRGTSLRMECVYGHGVHEFCQKVLLFSGFIILFLNFFNLITKTSLFYTILLTRTGLYKSLANCESIIKAGRITIDLP